MTEEEDNRKRKCYIIVVIALLIAFLAFSLAQNAQNTADNNANITNVFEIVVNNTNLAPTIEPSVPGTGERVTGVTYFANASPIQLMVFAHASSISQTAAVAVYINGTLVVPQSGRPLGGAEESNRSVVVIVPRFASYRVNLTNYHHYEWREYPILSGRNGTLSVNQTFITTGSNFNTSYFPYENSTRNVTFGIGNFSFVSHDGNSSVQIPNASVGAIVLHQERSPSFGETRNTTVSIDGVIGMKTYDDTTKTNATYLLSDIEHLFKINNADIAVINHIGLNVIGTINSSTITVGNVTITENGRISLISRYTSGGTGSVLARDYHNPDVDIMEAAWDNGTDSGDAFNGGVINVIRQGVAGYPLWLQRNGGDLNISSSHTRLLNLPASAQSNAVCFNSGTREITYNSGVTTCLASNESLKTNITPITGTITPFMMSLQPIKYKFAFENTNEWHVGFSAQSVKSVLSGTPYKDTLIGHNPDGSISGLRYEEVIPFLVKVIQEQQTTINSQQVTLNKICSNQPTLCQ